MRSIVIILIPLDKTCEDDVTDAVEFIDVPADNKCEPVPDADQLPLWRWFTFEKGP